MHVDLIEIRFNYATQLNTLTQQVISENCRLQKQIETAIAS